MRKAITITIAAIIATTTLAAGAAPANAGVKWTTTCTGSNC